MYFLSVNVLFVITYLHLLLTKLIVMKYLKSILLLCVMAICSFSNAQGDVFTNADNVALGGYDLVAYHNANDAIRGNSDHTVIHNEVIYYFSNAENATKFKESPASYMPAYGGHCAFAMAMKGVKVPTDPKTFKIRDGKLYLFFNDYYEGKPFNTIIPWNGNESDLLSKADDNWSSLKH